MQLRLYAIEVIYRVVFECLRMFVNNKNSQRSLKFRKSSLTSELRVVSGTGNEF